MIMTTTRDTRPGLCLLLSQHRQQAENKRDAGVELDAHEALRHGIRDILEVHRLALDEDANGNEGVEGGCGSGGRGGRGCCSGEQVGRGRRGAEEVARRQAGAGAGGLDLRGRVHALHGNGELPAWLLAKLLLLGGVAFGELYQEPGTDWMTMLDSLTPHERSLDLAPAMSGSMLERKELLVLFRLRL